MSSNLTSPVMVDGMDVKNLGLIPGAARQHIVTRSTTTDATYIYWTQAIEDPTYRHTTIAAAHTATTSARNDVVLLSPDSHSQAATLTWSNNMTHLVGMYGPAMMNQRSRIGHSVTVDPLLNVTGYGNTFANLYFMYGLANATDLTCMKVTGNRNSFIRCHFNAPTNATPADEATFKVLHFTETAGGDGLEHYFKSCTIGNDTTLMTDGETIKTYGTPRLVFEDCLILMRSDANAPRFIDGTAGDGQGFIIFKNTTLLNLGTTLTLAFASTGLAAGTDYVMHNSGVCGATDLIAAADEAKAWCISSAGAAADGIYGGLGIPFDHTA